MKKSVKKYYEAYLEIVRPEFKLTYQTWYACKYMRGMSDSEILTYLPVSKRPHNIAWANYKRECKEQKVKPFIRKGFDIHYAKTTNINKLVEISKGTNLYK